MNCFPLFIYISRRNLYLDTVLEMKTALKDEDLEFVGI